MATEKRLIDANAFRQSLELDRFGYTNIVKVNIALDKSTVDAVEVVRCNDCKHYKPQKQGAHRNCTTPYCMRVVSVKVRPDDFCSYGERRTNERKAD